jgi:cob(I)alamin adenosyltransferase
MATQASTGARRNGDTGTTALADGTAVSKNDPRVAAIGDLDESRSAVRFLAALLRSEGIAPPPLLHEIQQDLSAFEQELGTPGRSLVGRERVAALEAWLQRRPEVPAANAGTGLAAEQARVCRSVCRRAERTVVDLAQDQAVSAALTPYLNRLSDVMRLLADALSTSENDTLATSSPRRTP